MDKDQAIQNYINVTKQMEQALRQSIEATKFVVENSSLSADHLDQLKGKETAIQKTYLQARALEESTLQALGIRVE